MICRRCVFHNAQVEDKQFGKYAPSKKITHGRCKVEGTGAGEVASGMGMSRIAEQLARCRGEVQRKGYTISS